MESDFVGSIQLALKIDVSMRLRQLILRGDEVGIEIIETESSLKLVVSSIRGGFGIDFESLVQKVSILCARVSLVRTHFTEIVQVTLLICSLKGLPSILGRHVSYKRRVKDTVRLALGG